MEEIKADLSQDASAKEKSKEAPIEGKENEKDTEEAIELDADVDTNIKVENDINTETDIEDAANMENSETLLENDGINKEEKASKKKLMKKKKDKKDEKIEELNERLLRNMAEFDNFRKRSEKEKSMMFEIGAKSIIEKILPVVDNLERGFDALSEEEKEEPFAKGIEQIYKQFLAALEEAGVTPIEAVGKQFDPELHNAVMHDEDENFGENTVSQQLQKGYMYKDSVVRHSMVKVSN